MKKIIPKRLNHKDILFLDFISLERYITNWFQNVLDNSLISLVTNGNADIGINDIWKRMIKYRFSSRLKIMKC